MGRAAKERKRRPSSHERTYPRDLLQGVVLGTSPLVCVFRPLLADCALCCPQLGINHRTAIILFLRLLFRLFICFYLFIFYQRLLLWKRLI